MKSLIPSKIKSAKIRKTVLALLAIFALIALNFSSGQNTKHIKAGVAVSADGNTVTFGSGYFTVDGSGNVYQKEGSNIADTPEYIYPYVSYLSAPSMNGLEQINITNKNVIVSGSTVLMEETQNLLNLTVQSGGIISQPQPDREGKINRYQYSDQEWGLTMYGFVKVANGEKRKLTCPETYYDAGPPETALGNGCVISYSSTYDGSASIFDLADWDNFDKIWQTGIGAFSQTRYNVPLAPYIDNTTGSDQYYPVRFKFKNDYRDNRLEPMQVILRDDTNAVVGSASGVANSLIYGIDSVGSGLVDPTEQAAVHFSYYLIDEYLPTPAHSELGWISEDFSNAYATYTKNNIDLDTFFDGYGEKNNGVFSLEFDDRNAYNANVAATPFSKGTSGAVFDPEIYKTYTASNKTINPNMDEGPGTRYANAGLTIQVAGEVTMASGYIDVSGKGYAGYNMELRTENDDPTLLNVRGGGDASVSGNSGGLSSNNIAQGAAHAQTTSSRVSGYGGKALYQNGTQSSKNESVYGDKISGLTLGSGGGGASQDNAIPSHGGKGGGYIALRANVLRFTSTSTGIKANGENAYHVASGWGNGAGGSGGTVAINTGTLYLPRLVSSNKLFEAKGGGGININIPNTSYSSGGGGGYVRTVVTSFFYNGVSSTSYEQITNSFNVDGGCLEGNADYYGGRGQIWVDFAPIIGIDFPNVEKTAPISRAEPNNNGVVKDRQVFPDDTVNINLVIDGMVDQSSRRPQDVDIVIVSDTSGSMNDSVGGKTKITYLKEALRSLLNSAANTNNINTDQINLGLVNFNSTGDGTIYGPGDLDGCEPNQADPLGTACSDSFDHNNFMTTDPSIFTSGYPDDPTHSYFTYVNNLTAKNGTPIGAGLNNAVNHLTSNYSRSDARKYIILVSDGQENLPTCIAGPIDSDLSYPACGSASEVNSSLYRGYHNLLEEGLNLFGGDSYPIYRIANGVNNIGLITIQTTTDPINETFLRNLSTFSFSKLSEFTEPQYYGLSQISELEDAFRNTLQSIVTAPVAMPFVVRETLPPGADLLDRSPRLVVNADGYSGPTKYISPTSEARLDGNGRWVVEWNVGSNDYLPAIDFDTQKFSTNIRFKPGDILSGSTQDIDQNNSCLDFETVIPFSNPETGERIVNSYTRYLPVGNYSPQTNNTREFIDICYQFFSNVVWGDAYTKDSYLKNFAFYGNNLNLYNRNPGYGSTWNIPNYKFNPQSQSSFAGAQRDEYLRKITLYKNEAQLINSSQLNYSTYRLQGRRNLLDSTSQAESMPEGKIWLVSPNGSSNTVTIKSGAHEYSGKGTVIIDGDLKIEKGADIYPDDKLDDILGIIVLGNLEVGGDNTDIVAPIFVLNDFLILNSNVRMKGSFIANNFNIAENLTRVRLYYYENLDNVWPPGFRYFNMPTAKNSSN